MHTHRIRRDLWDWEPGMYRFKVRTALAVALNRTHRRIATNTGPRRIRAWFVRA